MCSSLILLIACLSLERFSCAVCLAGTCTSSVESIAQSSALLQQSIVPAAADTGWEYQSHRRQPIKDQGPSWMKLQASLKSWRGAPENHAKTQLKQTTLGASSKRGATGATPRSQASSLGARGGTRSKQRWHTMQAKEARDPHIRSALIDRRHHLIMGWSARAACTAAIKMFFQNAGMYNAQDEQTYPWMHDYREAKEPDIQPKESEMRNRTHLKFKIVRNPYRRAVSSWVHQMETNFSSEGGEVKWQKLAAKNGVNQSSSFLDWLRFVKKVGTKPLDDHSKPQLSKWEMTGGRYDVILRLESSHFDAILAAINYKSNSALKFNKTMHISPSRSASLSSHLDQDGGLVHPSTEQLYQNVESVKLVGQIYDKDFKAYGYDKSEVPIA